MFAMITIFILLGPPGAGKGTFAHFFKTHFGFTHCSVGDLVREEMAQRTSFGIKAEEILSRGDFLEEGMIQELIGKEVRRLAEQNVSFILDGYPRTEESARFLVRLLEELKLQSHAAAILLEADDAVCEARISQRIVCKPCGAIYNAGSSPPKQSGVCDACLSHLGNRKFDTPEVTRRRIEQYHANISQALSVCASHFSLIRFNTNSSIADCYRSYEEFMETR